MSHRYAVRGLKLRSDAGRKATGEVASLRGAWIEIVLPAPGKPAITVASLRGAWIEI